MCFLVLETDPFRPPVPSTECFCRQQIVVNTEKGISLVPPVQTGDKFTQYEFPVPSTAPEVELPTEIPTEIPTEMECDHIEGLNPHMGALIKWTPPAWFSNLSRVEIAVPSIALPAELPAEMECDPVPRLDPHIGALFKWTPSVCFTNLARFETAVSFTAPLSELPAKIPTQMECDPVLRPSPHMGALFKWTPPVFFTDLARFEAAAPQTKLPTKLPVEMDYHLPPQLDAKMGALIKWAPPIDFTEFWAQSSVGLAYHQGSHPNSAKKITAEHCVKLEESDPINLLEKLKVFKTDEAAKKKKKQVDTFIRELVPTVDTISSFLQSQDTGNLRITGDNQFECFVEKQKFCSFSDKFRQMSKRYRVCKQSKRFSLSMRGEDIDVLKGVIYYVHFEEIATPNTFAFDISAQLSPSMPGSLWIPDLRFAFELYEFSCRWRMPRLSTDAIKTFTSLIRTKDFHICCLNPFLSLELDFDISKCVDVAPIRDEILNKLADKFEAQYFTTAKVATRVFREVLGSVDGHLDHDVARVLNDRGFSFVIARRCVACGTGTDEHADECPKPACGHDLGLVGYKNEEEFKRLHWRKNPLMQPGKRPWCVCDDDQLCDGMVKCDGPGCKTLWFHFTCVRMKQEKVPKGEWFCMDCGGEGGRSTPEDIVRKIRETKDNMIFRLGA